ncbi:MAG: hypothetical protein RL320_1612 [Pseudomonadota bacterium]|jgi:outer membrane protein
MSSLQNARPRLLLSCLSVGALLIGPSAWALSLNEAAALALKNDPSFLAAEQSLRASQARKSQSVATLFPTLSASAAVTDVGGTGLSDHLTARTLTARVSQPVFNMALLKGAEQGVQQLVAAEAVFASARQSTLLKVASAYFDVLVAQDNLATVRSEKKAISEQLELAKRSFEVGTSTITDQQEAQARFDLIQAREIEATNALELRRNALALITRTPLPASLTGIRGAIKIPSPQPLDVNAWIDQARASGLGVQRSRAELETAKLETGRRSAGHLPTVQLFGSRSLNRETISPGSSTDSTTVGLEVAIGYNLGGLVSAQVREAIAGEGQADYALQGALLSAEQDTRAAFLNVVGGLAQVSALEAAERSSQLALDSNKLGYEVGVRINIDVLNAQQQLFSAQRDLSRARYETLLSSLRLKAAVGNLQSSDLEGISALMTSK